MTAVGPCLFSVVDSLWLSLFREKQVEADSQIQVAGIGRLEKRDNIVGDGIKLEIAKTDRGRKTQIVVGGFNHGITG